MRADVLVIGAGPGGSAAAYYLARGGAQVVLIDRAAFPRDKSCGDMLSGTAVGCLAEMGLGSLVAGRTNRDAWQADFGGGRGNVVHYAVERVRNGRPRWATIPRMELDAAVATQAQRAGAKLHERVTAQEMVVEPAQVRVRVSGLTPGEINAQLVIVAQGSVGKFVARPPDYFAVRSYYSGAADAPLMLRFIPRLAPGYEWQFPVGEQRYNIGVYSSAEVARRERLDAWLAQSALARDKRQLEPPRGAFLNATFRQGPAHAARVLWVGDAAGLVQPHLGEGIAPALQSGQIAAEYALAALPKGRLAADDLAGYTRALHVAFDHELAVSHALLWCMKRPAVFGRVGDFLAGHYDWISSVAKRWLPRARSSVGHSAS